MEERVVSILEDKSSHTMNKVVKRAHSEVYAVTVKERSDKEPILQTPVECNEALKEAIKGFEMIFQENLPQNSENVINRVEHDIEVEPGSTPPVLPIYRITQNELAVLKKRLRELMEKRYIRLSSSPYAASALFVLKKSGELRMCVDYRMLNKQTIKNKYPLPLIDELLDKLRKASYFSKLDLSDGYYQIPVKESDRAKTAFRTLYGHYEFTVMPFGLVNAPATFQQMMNDVLREFTNDFVVVYLDDIMIYSESRDQHVIHLRKVFQKLMEHQLYVKPSKSSYFQREAEYLGYIVRDGKVTPSPDKVQAIKDWPTPLPSVTAVKSFLGMAQFYNRFVRDFAVIAKPLTDLTRTAREFKWSEEAQHAVQLLKDELCTLSEMFLPDVQPPFILRIDASNFAIGAVVSQIRNNEEVLVAYFSRKLYGDANGTKPDQQGISKPTGEVAYPVHEQELLAIHDALQKWRHYLLGNEFTIFIPCRTTISAKETAKLFIKEVWRLHRLPRAIVSDRDPRFISSFWQALSEQLKITRNLSTAYYPESDGQTERTNRTIEQILWYFCLDQQHKWKEYIAQAEFAYNNAKHATTRMSPFFANQGVHPRSEFPQIEISKNEAANEFTARLKE